MTITAPAPTFQPRPIMPAIRLVVLLVVVLAAVAGSFVIGHATAHRTQVIRQVVVPTAPAPATTSSCVHRVGLPVPC